MVDEDGLRADRELARKAAQGDEGAWRVIYDATCDRLFSLLCYQVGSREDALDLLQETYVQAHRGLGRYRGDAPISAWLRTIALRKALDWKRKFLPRMRRTDVLVEETASVEARDAGVRFHGERAALDRALATLSPQQRAALLLREWDGWSFREIAGAIGCQENTARVHHTRARARMRLALGDLGAERDPAADAGTSRGGANEDEAETGVSAKRLEGRVP